MVNETKPDPTTDITTDVTVAGLGRMGHAVAAVLLHAGYSVTVWNRSEGKDEDLVAAGARRQADLALAAQASPVTMICLSGSQQVGEILAGASAAFEGRVVVNLSTGTPDEARELSGWASGHRVSYLDGAILAVPETVGSQDAMFLYGGDKAGYDGHAPLLEALSSRQWCGEDPGSAETWDAALLGTGYGALAGFLHGAAMMRTVGVTAQDFLPVAGKWLTGVVAFAAELSGEVDARRYRPAVSPVDLNAVAVDGIIRTSESMGVDASVHRPLQTLLARRLDAGGGPDSFSSIAEEMTRVGSGPG